MSWRSRPFLSPRAKSRGLAEIETCGVCDAGCLDYAPNEVTHATPVMLNEVKHLASERDIPFNAQIPLKLRTGSSLTLRMTRWRPQTLHS